MEDSTNSKLKTETIGVIITFVIIAFIIMMKANQIKKENATPRNGTVEATK